MPHPIIRCVAATFLACLLAAIALACDSADAPTLAPTASPSVTPTSTPSTTSTPIATPSAVPTPPTSDPCDDSTGPVTLLASLYDALNRRDFAHAYAYFDSPPAPSADEFARRYDSTVATLLALAPPARTGGAAGSEFAELPALTLAADTDGSLHTLVGCYTARRASAGVDPNASPNWRISMTALAEAPGAFPDATALENGCAPFAITADPPAYDDQSGPTNVLASLVNAINRKEFDRAYGYWAQPPDGQKLDKYIEGFANTEHILLALAPPTTLETRPQRLRAHIAAILVATRTGGLIENYFGCYIVARPADEPNAAWKLGTV